MQVSKLLVVALVCVVFISGAGAEMSAGGATATPRALLRASVLPAALPHAEPEETPPIDCCNPKRWCCVAAPAFGSGDSP
ncbi:unnamed protein product [Urochloa decumbens]|uniref:Uncharacterized protein n=1 Tax=Urochloa decumbens TaxID=240449 RepID=A0ABC9BAN2_9POAL